MMFSQIYFSEEMLPIYIYIHIYIQDLALDNQEGFIRHYTAFIMQINDN